MHTQVLRLLAARRAVSTITSACCHGESQEEDEGPFFDLDFRASSVRASSASSGSGSGSDSDEPCAELDFVISLQRSRSSSALPFERPKQNHQRGKLVGLRTLSFGARPKAARFSGSGRRRSSCSSSSSSSARSSSPLTTLRLFMETPEHAEEDDGAAIERRPSGDAIIRRCLSSISRRLTRFRTADAARRLRKCRSAPASRGDDSAVEKQDGIAGAIAHCKESFRRGI